MMGPDGLFEHVKRFNDPTPPGKACPPRTVAEPKPVCPTDKVPMDLLHYSWDTGSKIAVFECSICDWQEGLPE